MLALLIIAPWLLASCVSNEAASEGFTDISEKAMSGVVSLSAPPGAYLDVAWLDDKQLVFLYSVESAFRPQDYQVAIYTLDTEAWRVLTMTQPDECISTSIGQLQRLPNGNLGFVQQCHLLPYGEKYTLYMWDKQADAVQALRSYPVGFHAGSYTFAPDMSVLIQHETVGTGLNDQLYKISHGRQMQRIFREHFTFGATFRATSEIQDGALFRQQLHCCRRSATAA
jgi:hypothetical protein